MITALFFLIGAQLIGILALILNSLSYAFPTFLTDAIAWGAQYITYASGDLPLIANESMTGPAGTFGIIDVLAAMYSFFIMIFTFKLIILALSLVPFVGSSFRTAVYTRSVLRKGKG